MLKVADLKTGDQVRVVHSEYVVTVLEVRGGMALVKVDGRAGTCWFGGSELEALEPAPQPEIPATKAEIRARALAARLESAGWIVKVTVGHEPEKYFEDGRVMLQARVFVSVNAQGPNSWDDSYGFSFVTWLPAKGQRTSTRYAGGVRTRIYGKRRNLRKKLGLQQLHYAIASELDMARYRAQRESQEA